ncbi:DUF5343 domain-containing protein [Halofilum ochraceum]|uniref:DUF5343 domain-containing protein n=1 Tax=Halofilum ochraceum TaxID=1611323 RepID=UPI0008DAAFF1
MESIGFKSSNDRTLLSVLKFIDFVDDSSVPTSRWRDYRGGNHKQVLANAIREGYRDLFDVYPDANDRTASEIEHVVSTNTSAGRQAVTKAVRTFHTLCAEADFTALGSDEPASTSTSNESDTGAGTVAAGSANTSAPSTSGPSLHVDIQVHISPEASADQIDQIFESMSKHLYKQ